MKIQMTQERVTLAKVGVATFCIGAGVGYLAARRKFDRDLETALVLRDALDEAEMAETKETLDKWVAVQREEQSRKYPIPEMKDVVIHDSPLHPQHIIDRNRPRDLGRDAEALEGFSRAVQDNVAATEAPAEPETHNVFNDEWDQEAEEANRGPDAPYVIHANEYFNKESGFAQTPLVWYAQDQIVSDMNGVPVYGHERILGRLEFGRGSGDKDVVYIRNESRRGEYEVTRVNESFTQAVEADEAEQAAEEDELRHSNRIPRFRNDRD